jgi:hypothetical protein
VHDSIVMRSRQAICDFCRDIHSLLDRGRIPFEPCSQRFSFEARHRDEELAVFSLSDLVDRADVAVVE